jgi:hypothetical protein
MKRPAEEEKRRKDRDASHKERRGKEVMTGSLIDSVCETGFLFMPAEFPECSWKAVQYGRVSE